MLYDSEHARLFEELRHLGLNVALTCPRQHISCDAAPVADEALNELVVAYSVLAHRFRSLCGNCR